jgi:16S rRNA (cytosine967-C5)-methyltransferase
MKYFSHLHTAVQLIEQYRSNQPFGDYAKEFFRGQKKYGSTDRRQIMQLCYAGFRTGRAISDRPVEERILIGLFLISTTPNILLEHLKPEWDEKTELSLEEKCSIVNIEYSMLNIFPWKEALSEGIDADLFNRSFLIQPDLFLRMRPGREKTVKEKLQDAGIPFKEIDTATLALPNASKIDSLLEIDKEVVIQDLNSQRISRFLEKAGEHLDIGNVWDCCAGSGGKSIMTFDTIDHIKLTVSDIRDSILANLEKRFETAGIKTYTAFTADLASNKFDPHNFLSPKARFDLVIADVPCTGSGTWSRSPEHLSFFNFKQVDQYSLLQKNIVNNVAPLLLPGGVFLYITCSVFKKENEEVVQYIQENGLVLQHMELLKGYDQKADTLFAALFTA